LISVRWTVAFLLQLSHFMRARFRGSIFVSSADNQSYFRR